MSAESLTQRIAVDEVVPVSGSQEAQLTLLEANRIELHCPPFTSPSSVSLTISFVVRWFRFIDCHSLACSVEKKVKWFDWQYEIQSGLSWIKSLTFRGQPWNKLYIFGPTEVGMCLTQTKLTGDKMLRPHPNGHTWRWAEKHVVKERGEMQKNSANVNNSTHFLHKKQSLCCCGLYTSWVMYCKLLGEEWKKACPRERLLFQKVTKPVGLSRVWWCGGGGFRCCSTIFEPDWQLKIRRITKSSMCLFQRLYWGVRWILQLVRL